MVAGLVSERREAYPSMDKTRRNEQVSSPLEHRPMLFREESQDSEDHSFEQGGCRRVSDYHIDIPYAGKLREIPVTDGPIFPWRPN